ncbi:MAG: hypothetical protein AAF211_09445 [Myxococcota bacterium]
MAATLGFANDGFDAVKTANDCEFASRPREHPDGSAMQAVCDWPEVEPDVLARIMADLGDYERLIFALVESEVRERTADRLLVYQRQSVFGISDREVLLWVTIDESPERTLVSWRAASELPLDLRKGAIRSPRNEGYWRVEPLAGGGARVTHRIGVDAGGSIPMWIVRLVRTRGFVRVLRDVRAVGAAASVESNAPG